MERRCFLDNQEVYIKILWTIPSTLVVSIETQCPLPYTKPDRLKREDITYIKGRILSKHLYKGHRTPCYCIQLDTILYVTPSAYEKLAPQCSEHKEIEWNVPGVCMSVINTSDYIVIHSLGSDEIEDIENKTKI